MGHFLDVAYIVLKDEGRPLSHREIVEKAQQKRILLTKGNTPWQTLKSKLSTDILKNKEKSRFMRSGKGLFALREWDSIIDEYVADRYTKALLDEDIVVFPASSLPKYIKVPGLHASVIENSEKLLCECFPMNRRVAESDYSVIQLVSGFLVHYKEKFITYKRTKRLPETRLHDTYSILFGGHLNPNDVKPLFNIFKPEYGEILLQRELGEELKLVKKPNIKYMGLLYDDSRLLSSQHLGLLFDVELKSSEYKIGERGFLIDAKLESLNQVIARLSDFENWSVMIVKKLAALLNHEEPIVGGGDNDTRAKNVFD
ncbi:MAG: HTH domain-containing protein [Thermodesulfobacteriota bacterium]